MLNKISGSGGRLPDKKPGDQKSKKEEEAPKMELAPDADEVAAGGGHVHADLIRQNMQALEKIQTEMMNVGQDNPERLAELKGQLANIQVALENTAAANLSGSPDELLAEITTRLKSPGTLKGDDVLRHLKP